MKKKFAVLAILALFAATITPAHAAGSGYRYWGYFQAAPKATAWTAAMTGPTVDIADGSAILDLGTRVKYSTLLQSRRSVK